jgi:carboxyl-terminal processing protease
MVKKFPFLLIFTIALFLFNGLLTPSSTDTDTQLLPEAHHGKTALYIARLLNENHYEKKAIDDSLSSKIFDNYIKGLDPNRIYFLASDISSFETYRYQLDDMVIGANLLPAYQIFNIYLQRFHERMDYIFKRLDEKFDFSKKEYFIPDRSELPWAADKEQLDEIWRKRLKNEILTLTLSGKEWDKTIELLQKRYKNYLRRVNQLKSEDVFQQIMNSCTTVFDPHTNYFPPKNFDDFTIQMSRSLEGIGALLSMDDEYTKVIELVAGGPAERSRQLHPNDKITGVGQDNKGEIVDVIGWRLDDVVQLIRGPKGTTVRLQLIPADASPASPPDTIALVRDKIKLETLKSDTLEILHNGKQHKIGVIEIPSFYADYDALRKGDPNYNSTSRDVARVIKELKNAGVEGIIVDVRGNGGGFLSEAVDLTGLFIEKGPVVQVREANGRKNIEADRDGGRIAYSGPLAILVDRISASASEIFAAAIQDHDRGIIIGTQTFGKGTVQKPFDLNQLFIRPNVKLGHIKYTNAKFYRINGGSTQHVGVLPDIILPSRYTILDIGEDSNPFALLWDKISPLRYEDYDMVQPYLTDIKAKEKTRLKKNQVYADLVMEIEELETAQQKKQISLQESERKTEFEAAEKRRKEREQRRKAESNGDFVLNESAHILGDLIELSNR